MELSSTADQVKRQQKTEQESPSADKNMDVVVFDLDGTISNNAHRLHLIQCEEPDWKEYTRRCVQDPVVPGVARLMRLLSETHRLYILTGRMGSVRKETETWLDFFAVPYDVLLMRPDGTYVSNMELKQEWIEGHMVPIEKVRLVVDDHPGATGLWGVYGVPVLMPCSALNGGA